MKREVAYPAIVTLSADGKILAAMPLRAVPIHDRSYARWNTAIRSKSLRS